MSIVRPEICGRREIRGTRCVVQALRRRVEVIRAEIAFAGRADAARNVPRLWQVLLDRVGTRREEDRLLEL